MRRAEAFYNRKLLKKYFFLGFLKHHNKAKQEKEFYAAQGIIKQRVNNFISKLKSNLEESPQIKEIDARKALLEARQQQEEENRSNNVSETEDSPETEPQLVTPERDTNQKKPQPISIQEFVVAVDDPMKLSGLNHTFGSPKQLSEHLSYTPSVAFGNLANSQISQFSQQTEVRSSRQRI